MTNQLYPAAKDAFLRGEINLIADVIRVTLVDLGSYSFGAGHALIEDVPAGARIASTVLTVKSVAGGVFDAADAVLSGVTGASAEALVLWQDTGSEDTSRLIAFFDSNVAGFPVTPDGGDITIAWSGTGVFSL